MTDPAPPAMLPWPLRPPRRVAGLPVGLLICWQAALLLGLVAIGQPAGMVVGLGLAAALVVAVTGFQPGGRWIHEWVVLWLRYQLRGGALAAGQPPEQALLDLAAGVEAVDEVAVEDREVALISHRRGYTAVLELDPGDPAADLRELPVLLAPLPDPEAPAITVQLLARPGGPGQAAREWLAVQARRDPGHTPEELRGALVSALRRLRRRLHPEGRQAVALDRAGLLAALRALSWLEVAGPAAAGAERWDTWWTGGVAQQSLAVRSWPGLPTAPAPAVLAALLGPGAAGIVSVAAQRRRLASAHGALGTGDEVVAVELMVRLAGPDRAALAATSRQLTGRLAATGVRVEPLDGRQLPGLAGTLPLGGFQSGYRPTGSAFAKPPRHVRRPATPPAPAPAPTRPPAPIAAPAPAPVPVPIPVPAPAPATAEPAAPAVPSPARGAAPVPAALTGPSPARGQAQVPSAPAPVSPAPVSPASAHPAPISPAPAEPAPARGQAPVPPDTEPPTVGMPPTALRGVAAPPAPALPPSSGGPVHSYQPDPHYAVRAYGASLFTAASPNRARVEQLLAIARTPQSAPQVVPVLAGRSGQGASTTAAGLARTLATVRDDHTALLGSRTGPMDAATIREVTREHAFTVIDLGGYAGEATPQALAVSTRVVVVAAPDRRTTTATRMVLRQIHSVHPAIAGQTVIAVVCRTARQYRRVVRELSDDLSPHAAQIVPIPHDPAMRDVDHVDLTRLAAPTREAFLRLAAAVALPRTTAGAAPEPTHH